MDNEVVPGQIFLQAACPHMDSEGPYDMRVACHLWLLAFHEVVPSLLSLPLPFHQHGTSKSTAAFEGDREADRGEADRSDPDREAMARTGKSGTEDSRWEG